MWKFAKFVVIFYIIIIFVEVVAVVVIALVEVKSFDKNEGVL